MKYIASRNILHSQQPPPIVTMSSLMLILPHHHQICLPHYNNYLTIIIIEVVIDQKTDNLCACACSQLYYRLTHCKSNKISITSCFNNSSCSIVESGLCLSFVNSLCYQERLTIVKRLFAI